MPAPESEHQSAYSRRESVDRKGQKAVWFWVLWIVLIAIGATAAYSYSQHMQREMLTQLQEDTRKEISALKVQYDKRYDELSGQMDELDGKVQSFNELLRFTKDQASGKSDKSNKLYTQMNELKRQLGRLEKKMELLK